MLNFKKLALVATLVVVNQFQLASSQENASYFDWCGDIKVGSKQLKACIDQKPYSVLDKSLETIVKCTIITVFDVLRNYYKSKLDYANDNKNTKINDKIINNFYEKADNGISNVIDLIKENKTDIVENLYTIGYALNKMTKNQIDNNQINNNNKINDQTIKIYEEQSNSISNVIDLIKENKTDIVENLYMIGYALNAINKIIKNNQDIHDMLSNAMSIVQESAILNKEIMLQNKDDECCYCIELCFDEHELNYHIRIKDKFFNYKNMQLQSNMHTTTTLHDTDSTNNLSTIDLDSFQTNPYSAFFSHRYAATCDAFLHVKSVSNELEGIARQDQLILATALYDYYTCIKEKSTGQDKDQINERCKKLSHLKNLLENYDANIYIYLILLCDSMNEANTIITNNQQNSNANKECSSLSEVVTKISAHKPLYQFPILLQNHNGEYIGQFQLKINDGVYWLNSDALLRYNIEQIKNGNGISKK